LGNSFPIGYFSKKNATSKTATSFPLVNQIVRNQINFLIKKMSFMKIVSKISALAIAFGCLACSAFAQKTSMDNTVMVGGEAMYPKKTIVDNAVKSKAHTTLVAAVSAAGLVETLQSAGPFTVFAPVNDAFENLPEGTVETLLKPENKKTLTNVLTYHVVSGTYDFKAISALIEKGKGKANLKTVSGGTLTAMMNGMHNIAVKDENSNVANITTYDVYQSNGVIHSVDAVLLPKM
jgi:uncharacterized surface protein with fasciclin (FAS1) repeats